MTHTAREIAFLAHLDFLRESNFASKILKSWYEKESPKYRDFCLAQEIAYGSIRMARALDYMALQSKKIKRKERALLRTALYQICFMDKIPLYAVVDETVRLAKKRCSAPFAKFANALLRNLKIKELPEDFGIRFSYPDWYVEQLIKDFGLKKTKEILKAGNQPGFTMMRLRKTPFSVVLIALEEEGNRTDVYIQNRTPVRIMEELAKHYRSKPKKILDLCSAPGGKLLLAHDIFPDAELFANDPSKERLKTLNKNIEKYQLEANVSSYPGQKYPEGKFDLIILDAPCSNTGVLNKRPEARWRLTEANVQELIHLQEAILKHALTLLKEGGQVWYLTCSILKEENENLIKRVCHEHSVPNTFTQLPNLEGDDGGFGCCVQRKL